MLQLGEITIYLYIYIKKKLTNWKNININQKWMAKSLLATNISTITYKNGKKTRYQHILGYIT